MAKKNNGTGFPRDFNKDTKQAAINPKSTSGKGTRSATPKDKFPVDMSSDKTQPAINPK